MHQAPQVHNHGVLQPASMQQHEPMRMRLPLTGISCMCQDAERLHKEGRAPRTKHRYSDALEWTDDISTIMAVDDPHAMEALKRTRSRWDQCTDCIHRLLHGCALHAHRHHHGRG